MRSVTNGYDTGAPEPEAVLHLSLALVSLCSIFSLALFLSFKISLFLVFVPNIYRTLEFKL